MKLIDMTIKQLDNLIGEKVYYIEYNKISEHIFSEDDYSYIHKQETYLEEINLNCIYNTKIEAEVELAKLNLDTSKKSLQSSIDSQKLHEERILEYSKELENLNKKLNKEIKVK